MESTTIVIYFMLGIAGIAGILFAIRTGGAIRKGRRTYIKSPRLRRRAVLRDELNFGTAEVEGFEPEGGLDRGSLYLVGQGGRRYKHFYHADQIVPDNPLQAIAGNDRAIWRVNYQRYMDKSYSAADSTAVHDEIGIKNLKLKDELQTRKVETKQKLNEASTVPDMLQEVIREMSKPRGGNVEVVQKK